MSPAISGSSTGAMRPAPAGAAEPGRPVGVLLLVEYHRRARARGLARLALGRFGMAGIRGLRFFRFMGSGRDATFELVPSLSHQGLFLAFDDGTSADDFLASSRLVGAIREDARALLSMRLHAYSSRGRWGGVEPFAVVAARPTAGPVASLTRASIRPSKALRFWRHAPGAQAALAGAEGCLLAVGLGEAPLLRQATFTLWSSEAAMDSYARRGIHLEAIRAARAERHFHEDMFTRFVVSDIAGSWPGSGLPG